MKHVQNRIVLATYATLVEKCWNIETYWKIDAETLIISSVAKMSESSKGFL